MGQRNILINFGPKEAGCHRTENKSEKAVAENVMGWAKLIPHLEICKPLPENLSWCLAWESISVSTLDQRSVQGESQIDSPDFKVLTFLSPYFP